LGQDLQDWGRITGLGQDCRIKTGSQDWDRISRIKFEVRRVSLRSEEVQKRSEEKN